MIFIYSMKPLKMQVKLMIKSNRAELLRNAHPLTTGIRIALAAMCVSAFAAPQAFAQDQADASAAQDTDILEEVIVTGTRQLIQARWT